MKFLLTVLAVVASLMPMANAEAEDDLFGIAAKRVDMSTLSALAEGANLGSMIGLVPGKKTLFAPNDAAFAALPAPLIDYLVQPDNQLTLFNILAYHALNGEYFAADLTDGAVLNNFNGVLDQDGDGTTDVTIVNGKVMLDGVATVLETDILATDGIVHVIDKVLIPDSVELPEYYICKICGESQTSTMPNGIIDLGDGGATTCVAVYEMAQAALFNETFCEGVVQPAVKDPCGCIDITDAPTSMPTTSAPTVTASAAPTSAPTISMAPSSGKEVDTTEAPTNDESSSTTLTKLSVLAMTLAASLVVGVF